MSRLKAQSTTSRVALAFALGICAYSLVVLQSSSVSFDSLARLNDFAKTYVSSSDADSSRASRLQISLATRPTLPHDATATSTSNHQNSHHKVEAQKNIHRNETQSSKSDLDIATDPRPPSDSRKPTEPVDASKAISEHMRPHDAVDQRVSSDESAKSKSVPDEAESLDGRTSRSPKQVETDEETSGAKLEKNTDKLETGTERTMSIDRDRDSQGGDREAEKRCDPDQPANLRYCRLRALLRGNRAVEDEIRREATKGHYISTCTAVKEASELLHEFVVRNYLAGVDHFFFYDDNDPDSSENVTHVLRQFAPLITIQKPPDQQELLKTVRLQHIDPSTLRVFATPQHVIYWHCFIVHGPKTRWVLPIDADEFVEAKKPHRIEAESDGESFENIPFLARYLRRIEDNVPAQIARWNSVLTNNRIRPVHPSKVTLSEKYPVTCGIKDKFNTPKGPGYLFSAKSAIQPRYLDLKHYKKMRNFFVHGVKHWVDSVESAKEIYFSGRFRSYSVSINSNEAEWTILHYWSRSLADFLFKKERGRLNLARVRTLDELIGREDICRSRGHMGPWESATRRQGLVKELLQEVEGYDEIQLSYFKKVLARLEDPVNSEIVQGFQDYLAEKGEVPR